MNFREFLEESAAKLEHWEKIDSWQVAYDNSSKKSEEAIRELISASFMPKASEDGEIKVNKLMTFTLGDDSLLLNSKPFNFNEFLKLIKKKFHYVDMEDYHSEYRHYLVPFGRGVLTYDPARKGNLSWSASPEYVIHSLTGEYEEAEYEDAGDMAKKEMKKALKLK